MGRKGKIIVTLMGISLFNLFGNAFISSFYKHNSQDYLEEAEFIRKARSSLRLSKEQRFNPDYVEAFQNFSNQLGEQEDELKVRAQKEGDKAKRHILRGVFYGYALDVRDAMRRD